MKTEVKAKSTSRSETEYWNSAEHNRTKSRKKCPKRVTGHLFITVLAYHLVHSIRYLLKKAGITSSWSDLRKELTGQNRVTISMPCKNNEVVHIRKSTRPEPRQQTIYSALVICPLPGRTVKKIINKSSAITKSQKI